MIYLLHGYIDVFNHEIRNDNSKKLKLVTKTNDIVFEQNGTYNYNSKVFVDKIIEKVVTDYNSQNSGYDKIQLRKSFLKFSPKNKPHNGGFYNEHSLIFRVHAMDDTAHITFEEFNIIAVFKNELTCVRRDYILNKKASFEENQVRLITLPQHCTQLSINKCKNYRIFKENILSAIYNDISCLMIDELKKINLSKWNISLKETNLDIEKIITDNFKILIA
ncbi:hypothetical protein JK636_03095 [Clostridium sp. YIM B02515]|uniref:DUF3990 domain-containing protein n=1 Tax=Clostridium rhizosphaerae TaxID=2803861 RepID=A0ABS1T5W5_9CLOT|nr:hypothetical protein [Clostridium rhizosphaerae]MBL4934741.1 hypothetical protein [Clostridium rhizosphaerae]